MGFVNDFSTNFQRIKAVKCDNSNYSETELWFEDIVEVSKIVKNHAATLNHVSLFLKSLNHALAERKIEQVSSILRYLFIFY